MHVRTPSWFVAVRRLHLNQSAVVVTSEPCTSCLRSGRVKKFESAVQERSWEPMADRNVVSGKWGMKVIPKKSPVLSTRSAFQLSKEAHTNVIEQWQQRAA